MNEQAESYYAEATALAQRSSFVHDRALIDRATGDFMAAQGLSNEAESCYRRARETWLAWGAVAVVDALDQRAESVQAMPT